LKIGSTTGYTRPMLNAVMERAAAEGYAPDASVTPEEAGAGRPLPFISCAIRMRFCRRCIRWRVA